MHYFYNDKLMTPANHKEKTTTKIQNNKTYYVWKEIQMKTNTHRHISVS